ncbi:uncharacterized protein LOC131888742 [Tigriopus californicus]|uniref:uncharacterized protein LOC131888742 n=1 Tax=Tigriopus californicus TaxID=6832 RepID=UPI0027D9F07E|nr:uncharacterized protein LOC131888742 [Tigriopus californicus]
MNFKHVIILAVCICLVEQIGAAKKRRLVKRLKKQPLEVVAIDSNDERQIENYSRSDPGIQEDEGAESGNDRPRDARFIFQSVFGGTTNKPAPLYSYQYTPYNQELWGVESSPQQVPQQVQQEQQTQQVQQVSPYNYALTNQEFNNNPSYAQVGFPYQYEGSETPYYRASPIPGFDDSNVLQDKTFDSIQQAVTNAFNGPNGQNELDDNAKLARAVLPATVAAFLALTGPNNQRQRRDVEDNFILEDDNGDFPLPNTLPDYGQRLKDAIVMLAMIETHPDCMKKIACIFGRETKRSDQRILITDIVTKLMPKRLDGFTQEFIHASRNDDRSCESYDCSTCFSV